MTSPCSGLPRAGETAFAVLYQRYAGRLFAYFLLRCGRDENRAEDLRQQVFLNLLRSKAYRHPREGTGDLSSLLFSIAANLLKNDHRQRERDDRRLAGYRELAAADTVTDPEIDTDTLDLALRQLPAPQQRAIRLRFRHGLSAEEVAELTDTAPGTVRSRVHYGLKKLAALLRPDKIDRP